MKRSAASSISKGDHREHVLKERDELIVKHLDLVPPIARRVHRRMPPSVDLDDLIGEGFIGLMHAAQRYRPQAHGGTPFSAFARPRIHGAIVDSVRRKAYLENTAFPLEDAPEPVMVPALPFLITGTSSPLAGSRRGRPTPGFRADHLPKRLAAAVRRLPARQRAILGAFYGEAGSLSQIAALLSLTVSQVTSEHRKALATLHAVVVRDLSITGSTLNYFGQEAA